MPSGSSASSPGPSELPHPLSLPFRPLRQCVSRRSTISCKTQTRTQKETEWRQSRPPTDSEARLHAASLRHLSSLVCDAAQNPSKSAQKRWRHAKVSATPRRDPSLRGLLEIPSGTPFKTHVESDVRALRESMDPVMRRRDPSLLRRLLTIPVGTRFGTHLETDQRLLRQSTDSATPRRNPSALDRRKVPHATPFRTHNKSDLGCMRHQTESAPHRQPP